MTSIYHVLIILYLLDDGFGVGQGTLPDSMDKQLWCSSSMTGFSNRYVWLHKRHFTAVTSDQYCLKWLDPSIAWKIPKKKGVIQAGNEGVLTLESNRENGEKNVRLLQKRPRVSREDQVFLIEKNSYFNWFFIQHESTGLFLTSHGRGHLTLEEKDAGFSTQQRTGRITLCSMICNIKVCPLC